MAGKSKVLWITRTAILIALLIISQVATAPLGNMLVTGSIVNMILIVSVMTCGLLTGMTVGVVSPVIAKFLGIGPLWAIIPFIVAGNAALIVLWHFIGNRSAGKKTVSLIVALVVAAHAKFLVLYLGIVRIAIPVFLQLPEKQAAVVSNMFSIPQLITAAVGGALAIMILPALQKAIDRQRG